MSDKRRRLGGNSGGKFSERILQYRIDISNAIQQYNSFRTQDIQEKKKKEHQRISKLHPTLAQEAWVKFRKKKWTFTHFKFSNFANQKELTKILKTVRYNYLIPIYEKYVSIRDLSMKKDLFIQSLVELYWGEEPNLLKRQKETKNLEDAGNVDLRFFKIAGFTVPQELILLILSFVEYDSRLLWYCGAVNSQWYLLILSSWPHFISVKRKEKFLYSLYLLKNARRFNFRGHDLEVEHMFKHLDPTKVIEIDGISRPILKKIVSRNIVFPNVRRIVIDSILNMKVVLRRFPNVRKLENFRFHETPCSSYFLEEDSIFDGKKTNETQELRFIDRLRNLNEIWIKFPSQGITVYIHDQSRSLIEKEGEDYFKADSYGHSECFCESMIPLFTKTEIFNSFSDGMYEKIMKLRLDLIWFNDYSEKTEELRDFAKYVYRNKSKFPSLIPQEKKKEKDIFGSWFEEDEDKLEYRMTDKHLERFRRERMNEKKKVKKNSFLPEFLEKFSRLEVLSITHPDPLQSFDFDKFYEDDIPGPTMKDYRCFQFEIPRQVRVFDISINSVDNEAMTNLENDERLENLLLSNPPLKLILADGLQLEKLVLRKVTRARDLVYILKVFEKQAQELKKTESSLKRIEVMMSPDYSMKNMAEIMNTLFLGLKREEKRYVEQFLDMTVFGNDEIGAFKELEKTKLTWKMGKEVMNLMYSKKLKRLIYTGTLKRPMYKMSMDLFDSSLTQEIQIEEEDSVVFDWLVYKKVLGYLKTQKDEKDRRIESCIVTTPWNLSNSMTNIFKKEFHAGLAEVMTSEDQEILERMGGLVDRADPDSTQQDKMTERERLDLFGKFLWFECSDEKTKWFLTRRYDFPKSDQK